MLKQNKFISISFKKCENKWCSRNFIKLDALWPVQQKYLPSIKHSCKFLKTLIKYQCNKHHIPAFSTQLHLLNLGFKSSVLINKKLAYSMFYHWNFPYRQGVLFSVDSLNEWHVIRWKNWGVIMGKVPCHAEKGAWQGTAVWKKIIRESVMNGWQLSVKTGLPCFKFYSFSPWLLFSLPSHRLVSCAHLY